LDDDQLIICHAIDETVLIVNAPGPETGEISAQRLRSAGLPRSAAAGAATLLSAVAQ
jgi:hypothetical protein